MASDMVERVAKVLFDARSPVHRRVVYGRTCIAWSDVVEGAEAGVYIDVEVSEIRALARAAIAAMREPTAAMAQVVWDENILVEEYSVHEGTAAEFYTRMIDAALEGK